MAAENTIGNGSPEAFDSEWAEALASNDPRWLSYPAARPRTQVELFERVKAAQVVNVLNRYGIRGGRALEYACGSAGMAVFLAERGFNVVATDISPLGLKVAERNATRHNVRPDKLQLVGGDVFRLPFADNSFDVVMSFGLLEHFSEEALGDLLRETNRVLRPGGLHIVDIVHGRFSSRKLANYGNFAVAAAAQVARGRIGNVGEVFRSYFQNYYENKLRPVEWRRLFRGAELRAVQIYTCRPFPILAISGGAERAYVNLLKALLPLWRWFDSTTVPGVNWLGSMYFVHGVKPEGASQPEQLAGKAQSGAVVGRQA